MNDARWHRPALGNPRRDSRVGAARAGPRTPRVQDTLRSPVIGADGRVTFQLYAPKATDVTLRTEGPAPFAKQKLVNGDSGVWTLRAST